MIALGTHGSHSRAKQLVAIDFPPYMHHQHHHPIYSRRCCPEYGPNDHATYNDRSVKLQTFGLTPVLFCFMLSLLALTISVTGMGIAFWMLVV